MSEVRRARQRADGTFEEERKQTAKGVFRVHAAKPYPRLPADAEELPYELEFRPTEITCIHCGRPATRWDEPCGTEMAMIVRDVP